VGWLRTTCQSLLTGPAAGSQRTSASRFDLVGAEEVVGLDPGSAACLVDTIASQVQALIGAGRATLRDRSPGLWASGCGGLPPVSNRAIPARANAAANSERASSGASPGPQLLHFGGACGRPPSRPVSRCRSTPLPDSSGSWTWWVPASLSLKRRATKYSAPFQGPLAPKSIAALRVATRLGDAEVSRAAAALATDELAAQVETAVA
jgi:hypothetical protein